MIFADKEKIITRQINDKATELNIDRKTSKLLNLRDGTMRKKKRHKPNIDRVSRKARCLA